MYVETNVVNNGIRSIFLSVFMKPQQQSRLRMVTVLLSGHDVSCSVVVNVLQNDYFVCIVALQWQAYKQ